MTQPSSSSSPSSNNISSTPSTPTQDSQPKKLIIYSRQQLLALHDSPLCLPPSQLRPLSEWFGECDFTVTTKPQTTQAGQAGTNESTQPPGQRTNNFSQFENNSSNAHPTSSSPNQTSTLPVLGRGQPPARNPFANFGKFGTEETSTNSFSIHLNGHSATSIHTNGQHKVPRRLMDRDLAPHVVNDVEASIHQSTGRRANDDRQKARQIDQEQHQQTETKLPNRRNVERFAPDRELDEDRSRSSNRERDQNDKDRDNQRNNRSSGNQRDTFAHHSNGDDSLQWRRGATGNNPNSHSTTNKRLVGDHPSHKDTREVRDKDSSGRERDYTSNGREKAREKALANQNLPANPQTRTHNYQNRPREREKENSSSSNRHLSHDSNLVQVPHGNTSNNKGNSPLSPLAALPYTSRIPVKDGAWDSGDGKWEISKQNSEQSYQGTLEYNTASETDAIQAWKAEMKAMEARKQQAVVSSSNAVDKSARADHDVAKRSSSTDKHSSLAIDATDSVTIAEDPLDGALTTCASLKVGESYESPKKQFSFLSTLTEPEASISAGGALTNSTLDEVFTTRASRFAKFFDNNQKDDAQAGLNYKLETATLSEAESGDRASASADPENMARVLSMLQMSSQQTVEPNLETMPSRNVISTATQFLNSNPTSHSHNNQLDLLNFLQQQRHNSSPKSGAFSQNLSLFNEAELNDRSRTAAGVSSRASVTSNPPASATVFHGSTRRLSQQSSPVHQLRGLDDIGGGFPGEVQFKPVNQSNPNMPNSSMSTFNRLLGGHTPGPQSSGAPHNNQHPSMLISNNSSQQSKGFIEEGVGARANNNFDPQIFQLQSMLNSVSSIQPQQTASHDRLQDNQKLAFLARQLQQQRLSPNNMANSAHLANSGNLAQSFSHLSTQNLASSAGHPTQLPGSANRSRGLVQIPPGNGPHSGLGNLFLGAHHHPPSPHHPGVITPALNFAAQSGLAGIGGIRPGGGGSFGHNAPQGAFAGLQPHQLGQHHHQQQLQQLQQQQQQLQQIRQAVSPLASGFGNPANHQAGISLPFLGPGNHQHPPPHHHGVVGVGVGTAAGGGNNFNAFGGLVNPMANNSGAPGPSPVPFSSGTLPNVRGQVQLQSLQNGSSVHHQLDLMSLLNAGSQRRIGM
ncbi:hypothetical protein BY996DRAFT_4580630 [Phakopsora pachyrhizi]|nr:hypothetical protein BY996DRAFT_4580630 [Phakopsora pachyrhizi]